MDDSPIKTRTVRLVLIEYISGSSMLELRPQDFTQLERKQIIRHIIDGESAMYTRDVRFGDPYPGNIIVEQDISSKEIRIKRIVLLDFGMNILPRHWIDDPEEERKLLPGTYISPLLRWHEVWGLERGFSDWIDWDYLPWLRTQYAHTAPSITPYMKFQ